MDAVVMRAGSKRENEALGMDVASKSLVAVRGTCAMEHSKCEGPPSTAMRKELLLTMCTQNHFVAHLLKSFYIIFFETNYTHIYWLHNSDLCTERKTLLDLVHVEAFHKSYVLHHNVIHSGFKIMQRLYIFII